MQLGADTVGMLLVNLILEVSCAVMMTFYLETFKFMTK